MHPMGSVHVLVTSRHHPSPTGENSGTSPTILAPRIDQENGSAVLGRRLCSQVSVPNEELPNHTICRIPSAISADAA